MTDWADDAAMLVLDDLCGRKGVGDELEDVRRGDPETWSEIRATLAKIIRDEAP